MWTGTTLACLNFVGTIPLENEVLNKICNGLAITVLRIFKTDIGILKGPVALPVFSLEISISISAELIGGIKAIRGRRL